MRNSEEMLQLIMNVAKSDERIRAVTMEGSRDLTMAQITYSEFMTPEEYNFLRKSVGWMKITPEPAKR